MAVCSIERIDHASLLHIFHISINGHQLNAPNEKSLMELNKRAKIRRMFICLFIYLFIDLLTYVRR